MDFPEFLALVAFVIQNVKRGLYGRIVGSVFETVPDEPEAVEDILEIVTEPNFIAQFSTKSNSNSIILSKALPIIKKYILKEKPSVTVLYEWIEELINNNQSEMPIVRFVEVIHDVADKYYAEFEDRSRVFHEEQLYRWVGEDDARACAVAFSLYTDKSSVLARTQLEPFLVDLGYPVTSHEESKEILKEFSHPKDKSTVLYAELLHIIKSLSVVRYKAENGRGDFTVDERGIKQKINHNLNDKKKAAASTNDMKSDSLVSPLHVSGSFRRNSSKEDEDMKGVDVEVVNDGENPDDTPDDTPLNAFELEKKKRLKSAATTGAPSGGYMLLPKNLLKKKFKKVRVKDEVDEEGYVKPKSAYEIFVHTNPTNDQLELLFQWNNLMTEMEKNAFKREAKGMREAYDQLKGGVVNREQANEVLKRKGTTKLKSGKHKKDAATGGGGRPASLLSAPSGLPSESGKSSSSFMGLEGEGGSTTDGGGGGGGASGGEILPKINEWETASAGGVGEPEVPVDLLPEDDKPTSDVVLHGVSEENRSASRPLALGGGLGSLSNMNNTGLSNSKPIVAVSQQVVENHSGHLMNLAVAPPPTPPSTNVNAPAKHRTSSIVVPQGLSATGVPAELTASTSLLDEPTVTTSSTHIAKNMSHMVGPMTSLAPPPPPKASGGGAGTASSLGGRPSMAPAPSYKSNAALSMPLPPQFADPRLGGSAPPPPPPPPRR